MRSKLIAAENLYKSFPTSDGPIEVLRGVDLDVEVGDCLVILGQSGVGKSTLLHILGTLDRPTSGRVRFKGKDLGERSEEELARFRNRVLGFVFQFHHLLPEFSALENVMMPGLLADLSQSEMRERAISILDEVGLEHRLGHRVGKLSGGERQRVAVARALVLDPELVLADEPTGNLDPTTGDRVAELLLELNQKRRTALVIATHSARLAGRVGRACTLVEGRLIESDRLDTASTIEPSSNA